MHQPNNYAKLNTPRLCVACGKVMSLYATGTRCDKCDISYNNPSSLEKHKPIHLNPVYCPFTNCNKIFSPTHKYQFKQHIDGHNGGLHIKCKFCNHTSKTLT